MICGGMFVGYGVLNMYFSSELLKYYTTNAQLIFVAVSFHVSSIIGAISAGFLYNFLHILKLHVSHLNCECILAIIFFSLLSFSVIELFTDDHWIDYTDIVIRKLCWSCNGKNNIWIRFWFMLREFPHVWV